MYVMRNLPLLLPLVASVILCVTGIYNGFDFKEFSVKLVLAIVIFYIFGVLIRNMFFTFLVKILHESERKAKFIKQAKEKEHQEREKLRKFNEISNMRHNQQYEEYEEDEELEPYTPNKI